MKLKTVLAASLLLTSCIALAQPPDTKDTSDPVKQDTKPEKPRKTSGDKKATKSDDPTADALTLLQDLYGDQQSIPVLGDLPIIGPLFQSNGAGNNQALSLTWSDVNTKEMNQRVSLDVTDMPVKEALKQLFDQAKLTFEAEKDVPDDAKVTVKLNNVRFVTALNAVTEAAGISWQRQVIVKDKKATTTFKVGKKLKSASSVYQWNGQPGTFTFPEGNAFRPFTTIKPNQPLFIPKGNGANAITLDHANGVYNLLTQEDRHTFTCPHCGQQVTIIGKRQAPKCEKCGRTFQSDWKFCPFDGTKRPSDPDVWQYCPHCGKRVSP